MLDYQKLLRAYMKNVIWCESVDFLSPPFKGGPLDALSNDEMKYLRDLSEEFEESDGN